MFNKTNDRLFIILQYACSTHLDDAVTCVNRKNDIWPLCYTHVYISRVALTVKLRPGLYQPTWCTPINSTVLLRPASNARQWSPKFMRSCVSGLGMHHSASNTLVRNQENTRMLRTNIYFRRPLDLKGNSHEESHNTPVCVVISVCMDDYRKSIISLSMRAPFSSMRAQFSPWDRCLQTRHFKSLFIDRLKGTSRTTNRVTMAIMLIENFRNRIVLFCHLWWVTEVSRRPLLNQKYRTRIRSLAYVKFSI
jgi:hypothetical protein